MNRSHQSPNFYHQFEISYLAAFERMTRLNENALVDQAVQCHVICTLGRLPDSSWRRPPCRPCSRWIDHLQIREGALSNVVLDYDLMPPSMEYCNSIDTPNEHFGRSVLAACLQPYHNKNSSGDEMNFLWSPYGIGQTVIFLPCGFFFLLLSSSFFFSSPNLSRRRVDVCHTCTHGVALVRI